MPLTFIDIEKQKTWRIWTFFLVLMALYFIVCLAFALPFILHAQFLFSRFWPFALLIAFVVAGIHFLITGYGAVATVLASLNAQKPDAKDDIHKTFVNILQEINIAAGNQKSITGVVIPTLSLNAFAAADLKGQAVIGITEGLLSRLTRPQLEAVIAHEAHHILSRDCLESTIAANLFGALVSLLERSSESERGDRFLHPAFLPAWVLLKLSYLLNMFISREREYRADAAAVRMTRNPVALAETLYLLSRSWRGAGFIGSGYEMICIVNPTATVLDESEGFWADLLSTHPPIQKRIQTLLTMAHMNITGLTARIKTNAPSTGASSPPVYYAMSPQQQWQGPFTLAELGALPWLSPLSWIRMGEQPVDRAWKDPSLNTIFLGRLNQEKITADYSCPVCHQPLITESYEGTQIYQCRFCAGTLVDSDKIPRILARTGRERSCSERIKALAGDELKNNQAGYTKQKLSGACKKSPVPLIPCPKCKNPLYRGFYSGAYLIEIDRCSFCGLTWFGQDELEMLQSLIKKP